jgi:hypothetical protein
MSALIHRDEATEEREKKWAQSDLPSLGLLNLSGSAYQIP